MWKVIRPNFEEENVAILEPIWGVVGDIDRGQRSYTYFTKEFDFDIGGLN